MIDKLIGFSIKNKLIIGLGVVGLIVWGSYALKQLPIDAVPDITNNQVQVITVVPSIAAQEVERLITYPVEKTMATIPGIEEIRSFSRFGLSAVTIVFEDGVDVYWARQQVNERLAEAKNQIPNNIGTPAMAPVTTGLGEIYQYVVHTKPGYEDKYSVMELRTIQDWIVKRQLLGTPGVADVSSFGGFLKQYEVAIDPQELKALDVSIAEIFTALEKNNQNTGGAYIDKQPNAYFIRSEGMIGSIEDIKKIVVKANSEGQPILIGDVANVAEGSATRYGASTRNGEGEVVSAIVMMLKGSNSAKVIADIKDRIAQIQKTLPEGVVIEPFLDRTKLVDSAIGTVTKNLIEGALIVLFILILFLGNFRAGIIVASVIPLAMLFAIGMMNLFGVSGNLMSLGAIDFGLIVDGAVIIVESILHHIVKNRFNASSKVKLTQQQMNEEVYSASSKIRSTAAFGEIIILIVYLPILALVGIEGKMFGPMAQTVSFAILGAFLLSLTYVPMMSALVLNKKTEYKRTISDRMMDFFQRIYSPIIRFALNKKKTILFSTLGLFVVSLLVFRQLGGEFIPSLDEGDFAIETRVMTGSSLSETIDASNKAAKILKDNFPEVEQVVGKIGSGEIPTDPMPVEACDLMVILKEKAEWTSASTREELAEKMATALEAVPGVTFGFQQPIQMRFNELMTGARQDVVIKLYGEDLDVLTEYAAKIGDVVNTVEGAVDLYLEEVTGLPQIQIDFNRDEIAKYDLNIEEINTVIETAFAGKSAGIVYEGERRFDLVVRMKEQSRAGIEDVSNLFIPTPDGDQIPLNQLAAVYFKEGPSQIQRDDTKRRITIGFNVRNRDVESIVEEIKSKVAANIDFPTGYYPTYGGQFENLIQARNRLLIAVPVALLLIFTLLFFTFKSIKQSLLIFTAIPLSAIGGVFALYVRDMPFSISAGVGFIALFGVAVLNGIVLIGEFNRLKTEGTELIERVIKGTRVRLRPVLMTAMVASCGFLPMALSNSSGAEVQRPLATVVIGGLITATFLTLVVLPVLYIYFEKNKIRMKKNKALTILIGLLGFPMLLDAQTTIVEIQSVEEVIAIARERNGSVQIAQLGVDQSLEQKKMASDIGKTQISWQHGQYNSAVKTDNYFDVSHSFAFPTVYVQQSKLLNSRIEARKIDVERNDLKLVQNVRTAYSHYLLMKAKVHLYATLDSNYAIVAKNAALNYEAGNNTLLDKMMAETNAMEMKNLFALAQSDVGIAENQLRVLMNLDAQDELRFINDALQVIELRVSDTLSGQGNPLLEQYLSQIKVNRNMTSVERAKLLPDITIGYFNQSLIGTQTINNVEQTFGASDRFQGFRIGLAIPIWIRPQLAKVNSMKLETAISEANYQQVNAMLQGEIDQAYQEYIKQKGNLLYYSGASQEQVQLMQKTAEIALINGEINHFEYTQVISQCIQLQLKYLEAIHAHNQSIIHLEHVLGVH